MNRNMRVEEALDQFIEFDLLNVQSEKAIRDEVRKLQSEWVKIRALFFKTYPFVKGLFVDTNSRVNAYDHYIIHNEFTPSASRKPVSPAFLKSRARSHTVCGGVNFGRPALHFTFENVSDLSNIKNSSHATTSCTVYSSTEDVMSSDKHIFETNKTSPDDLQIILDKITTWLRRVPPELLTSVITGDTRSLVDVACFYPDIVRRSDGSVRDVTYHFFLDTHTWQCIYRNKIPPAYPLEEGYRVVTQNNVIVGVC